ncbi:MAG: RNA polymerase sigma-70 factor [Bacteroidales bacterium]|nr:RNA polymerase sigma-70 factor [Bacteroidales bacterium]
MVNLIDLHKKIREGDPEAFKELFKMTHARLMGYCRLFVPEHAIADDLVQDCYLKLWEKRSSLKPEQSVESLLFVMLRHQCLNYLRNKNVFLVKEELDSIKDIELQHLFELDFTGSEQKIIEEELIDAIKESIQRLPQKRKTVLIKSKLEGLKNKDVADELGISIKAVEKHLHQAKEQIRKQLITKYPRLFVFILTLFI